MKKVLVTAFEPRKDILSNSSMAILNRLSDDKDIKTFLLPVSYKKARFGLIDAIDKLKPDYILALDMASSANSILIEKLAINYQYSKLEDNDGIIKLGDKIDLGLDAIFTRFNENEILNLLLEHHIRVDVSLSCGGDVANTVYYTALEGTSGKALFLHLPQESKDFTLEEMEETVKRVVDYLKNIEIAL